MRIEAGSRTAGSSGDTQAACAGGRSQALSHSSSYAVSGWARQGHGPLVGIAVEDHEQRLVPVVGAVEKHLQGPDASVTPAIHRHGMSVGAVPLEVLGPVEMDRPATEEVALAQHRVLGPQLDEELRRGQQVGLPGRDPSRTRRVSLS